VKLRWFRHENLNGEIEVILQSFENGVWCTVPQVQETQIQKNLIKEVPKENLKQKTPRQIRNLKKEFWGEIATKLRKYRKEQNMTRMELAHQLGISTKDEVRLESNLYFKENPELIEKAIIILNLDREKFKILSGIG